MLVEPGAAPSARPCVPGEVLTPATADWVEFHVTNDVISGEVPSLYLPVAVNCWVVPFAIVTGGAFPGEIVIPVNCGTTVSMVLT